MTKIVKIIVGILAVIAIIIGGWKVKEQVEYNQMVDIVKSEEVQILIEESLKIEDPQALTLNGVIQSYDIDMNSIKRNPMGGIMFNIKINDDDELYGMFGLQKDSSTGKIIENGMDLSAKLAKLLEGE